MDISIFKAENNVDKTHQQEIIPIPASKPSIATEIISSTSTDLHSTKWSDINLIKFGALITVSSTIENAIFYPFFVLKTREQSDRRNLTLLKSFQYHLRTTLSKSNSTGVHQSLYRGFWLSNFVSMPAYGLYLGVYVSCKDQLSVSKSRSAQFYAPFIAGFVADIVSILFYVPGDVIVQRLQVVNSPYKSAYDAARKIYANEGIKGYYRGLGATFVVSAFASSLWWTVYENLKSLLYRPPIMYYLKSSSNPDDNKTHVPRMPQFVAGFMAGTITSTCVNPMDVVKTRIQTQNIQTLGATSSTVIYKNMFHGLKCLWSEEGFHGLFRGVLPKLMSRGPLSAISAVIFELVLYYSKNDS